MNESLAVTKPKSQYGNAYTLNIIDSPGKQILIAAPNKWKFEISFLLLAFKDGDLNGLRELCSNYCNEAFHLQYLQSAVRKNQATYQKDGLNWEPITFESNRLTVDLIGQPFKGMLSILDEGFSSTSSWLFATWVNVAMPPSMFKATLPRVSSLTAPSTKQSRPSWQTTSFSWTTHHTIRSTVPSKSNTPGAKSCTLVSIEVFCSLEFCRHWIYFSRRVFATQCS